jgi:3D-(3,5/4)-trihydroxycyclohexane-1,2-dione acylhydrolase (decyclizing)
MRVLSDPAETGAVTLAMPEDVQAEAFEVPDEFLQTRVWTVFRQPPAPEALAHAASLIRGARRPLIVAGGGVIYSEATAALRALVDATGIPVGETMAGRGALVSDHPVSLGAIGATGGAAANRLAREADLVVGVGTRWSDFTTASHTAFQDPGVRFVNVNVAAFDAGKQSGLPVVADARVALEELRAALAGWRVDPEWERRATAEAQQWGEEVARVQSLDGDHAGPPTQAQIIKEINDAAGETGVMVCAAGSAPGDLHKLWRARDPDGKGYHVEYGYSCMGYEIPGGIGVKLAAPEREVYVLVGDGSYLMLPGELVTAVAQRVPLVIVLVDNHGYASIGALSRSIGSEGFGTLYRFSDNGSVPLDPASTEVLPLDLATNAESLGARVVRAKTIEDLREALVGARGEDGPVVIHIEADRYRGVPSYESWWDVPVAEVSEEETVRAAREGYERAHAAQRQYLRSTHE